MSFTPAPLRAIETTSTKWDESGDHAIVDSEGKIIGEAFVTVGHRNYRPARANAVLWAAAPDLYEAAKGIIAAFDAGVFVLQALAKLIDAVDKVEGQIEGAAATG